MNFRMDRLTRWTAALALSATMALAVTTTTAAAAPRRAPVTFHHVFSKYAFGATVSALKRAVSANGMMVLGTLNQAGALSVTGLQLKGAESFFVGSPVMGKMAFKMDPAVGAVIPVRIYVWVDSHGKTELGYFLPSALLERINPATKAFAAKLDMGLAKILHQAAG